MEIVSGTRNILQTKANNYGNVFIKDNRRPNFVNHDQTSIQKQIGLSVTNGRGYETLLEAIDIVNLDVSQDQKTFFVVPIFPPRPFKISLYEAQKEGLIPLSFGEEKENVYPPMNNPCGEILLGQPQECSIPIFPIRLPTLVERLGTIAKIKWDSDCRNYVKDLRGLFS